MSKTDVLKSWVRTLTSSVAVPLRRLSDGSGVKRVWQQLQRRRISISDARLTAAVGHLPALQAATVRASRGRLGVELTTSTGQNVSASLRPCGVRFAPRGAKEIVFAIEPPAAASATVLGDVAAAVGQEVALALWGPLLGPKTQASYAPHVDREGTSLTLDLRDLPAVRSAVTRGVGMLALDMVEITGLTAEDGQLTMQVKLPELLGW